MTSGPRTHPTEHDEAVRPRPRRPVRIGVQIAPQHAPYEKIRDTAATLERKLGVLADHGRAVGRDVREIEISTETA